MSRRQPPWAFAQKVPSFRGAAEGCEPGTHIPEAGVYGFRAHRCAAPRNDGPFGAEPPIGERGKLERAIDTRPAGRLRRALVRQALPTSAAPDEVMLST